jgi:hypothetical protein
MLQNYILPTIQEVVFNEAIQQYLLINDQYQWDIRSNRRECKPRQRPKCMECT